MTQAELRAEVEKAKNFEPPLSEFTIATTGPKDAQVEKLARQITLRHRQSHLFSVHVCGWQDILEHLADYPDLLREHYSWLFESARGETADSGFAEANRETLEAATETRQLVRFLYRQQASGALVYPTSSTASLTAEYQEELNYSRDLLDGLNPVQALDYLEKLKKRIWSNAQPMIRYRILTNMGAAKLSLEQSREAALLFIEALQYNEEDEQALCNVALGHLMLGQAEKAKPFVAKVRERNPASERANSLFVQLASADSSLEEIAAGIDEPYRGKPEVAYAIGHLAYRRNLFDEAKKWLGIAVDNDSKGVPDLRAAFAEVLVMELQTEAAFALASGQLDAGQRTQLQTAAELLSFAWKCIKDTDLRGHRLRWMENRALIKRALGDLKGALDDIAIALAAEPSNPELIRNRAVLCHEIGESEEAINLLSGILSDKVMPEVPLLLAEVLSATGRTDDAIRVVEESLKGDLPNGLKRESRRFLVRLHLTAGSVPCAKSIADSARDADPTDALCLVDAAKIASSSGADAAAKSLLREAITRIEDFPSPMAVLELADELYRLGLFEDAVRVYERVVNRSLNTPLTHKLRNSLYWAGDIGKALEMCSHLHKTYGLTNYLAEMESAIYEEIGDLPAAKSVCQEYLAVSPNDLGIGLRLAIVNYQSRNFAELDGFLGTAIDQNKLSLGNRIRLAHLYAARGLGKQSLETLYEARRTYFNESEAHVSYALQLLLRKKGLEEWLDADRVSVDTAVHIQDSSGERTWYVVEDREDADLGRKEVKLTHALARAAIGKSAGDEFVLRDTRLTTERVRIVEVKSKYVYALQETLAALPVRFPDARGLDRVQVKPPTQPGQRPEAIEFILNEIGKWSDYCSKVEELYRKGNLTIGAFANLVARDPLVVWSGLVNKPDPGVRCCSGAGDERAQGESLLNNGNRRLIVDVVSLMTLYELGAANVVAKVFGRLGVVRSILDLLYQTIDEKRGIESRGLTQVGKNQGTLVRQEITAEEVRKHVEHLESVAAWIEGNCDVLPCKPALRMSRPRKEELEKLFGAPFVDTILVASEPGNLLYSDDMYLRQLAKTEFQVNGVWSQVVLMHCLRTQRLEKREYDRMTIKLACSHYYYTSIDAGALTEAARQAAWSPSEPYRTVLKILSGQSTSDENSAAGVATEFLHELWEQRDVTRQQRGFLVSSLLDTITVGRNRRMALARLLGLVRKRFEVNPLAQAEIRGLASAWERVHVT